MSAEKKVFFLFILFIILNVACVYNYTQNLEKEEMIVSQDKELTQTIEEEKEPLKEIEEKPLEVQEPKENQEQIATLNEEEIKEEPLVQKPLEKAEEKIKEKVQETVVDEEVVKEEIPEALLKGDKRYKRVKNQKYIEELSIKTQELQIKINELVKNSPIIFKRASNKITKNSNKTVKDIAQILKENPSLIIEVAGHTDSAGPENLNLQISEQRSISVKNRLRFYGIDKKRIVARGYGETIPLVKNSKEGYSLVNRRVEFNIVEE